MKIIYIKETEEIRNVVRRILLKVKKVLNVIKIEDNGNNRIYCIPIFKNSKLSKFRIKKIAKKINILLERDGSNTVALSEYLNSNQIFKNYLYSKNINILDGRFLFKCLIYKTIEYIFKIKNKAMEFRRSFIAN